MSKKKEKIVHYKIEDVNPANYNPRNISEASFQGLVESIKKFNMPQPLIVNIRDGKNVLVGGHQRLKALEHLKWKEVPVIEVDLDPIEEKALNVALNNPAIQGEFTDSIKDILAELEMQMPEDFFNLKLNQVPVPTINDDWDTDLGSVENTEANTDGIMRTVKVICDQDDADDVREVITKALDEAQMLPNVEVK